jgi:hypothetical protein
MAQAAAGKTNWFAIWVSVAVVAVVALVIALVVWMNNAATSTPRAAQASTGTGRRRRRLGEQTLDTYVDFMCPICNQFEKTYGDRILDLVNNGKITLNIHPIAILDRYSQGTVLHARRHAMYCVAEADPMPACRSCRRCSQNQPQENSPGLTDDQILEIAKSVGVDGIDSCVTDGTYIKFVASMTEKTPSRRPASARRRSPSTARPSRTAIPARPVRHLFQ